MQSWLPVIVVWFLSLLISVVVVCFAVYKKFNKNKRRRNGHYTFSPPGILLLLLALAFIIGFLWFVTVCNTELNEARVKKKAWLFIGLFIGCFSIICILFAILWTKKRISERSTGRTSFNDTMPEQNPRAQKDLESPPPSMQESKYGDNKITSSNYNQGVYDDFLVLRNLSNPDEDYWINLSSTSVPVISRHLTARQTIVHERTPGIKSNVLTLEDGFTIDIQC